MFGFDLLEYVDKFSEFHVCLLVWFPWLDSNQRTVGSSTELHGISWGAGLLFTSEGLRAYCLSTAPCHTYQPLSLLPAKAGVHNLYRRTQRRLLCQPRLDCTV